MPAERVIEPEWLDHLPSAHPGAIGSRRDLQRLNFLMGHASLMAKLLKKSGCAHSIHRLVELRAGDGTFMLKLARRMAGPWEGAKAVLVDQHELVSDQTRKEFHKLGWEVEVLRQDAFVWLVQAEHEDHTAIISNLFLHHFEEKQLRTFFSGVSEKTHAFVACEPRRCPWALKASKLLGLI